jgi:8-oxo-dGTP diphosphatase
MRHWTVGGGVVRSGGEILLVQNRRRGGALDWSTPGGVIDAGESVIEGLTREVAEETGLAVREWSVPAYRVEVEFAAQGWYLEVASHLALDWTGELHLADPDGIVVDARFVARTEAVTLLGSAPRWVGEPLLEWLASDADPAAPPTIYRYQVDHDHDGDGLRVERRD